MTSNPEIADSCISCYNDKKKKLKIQADNVTSYCASDVTHADTENIQTNTVDEHDNDDDDDDNGDDDDETICSNNEINISSSGMWEKMFERLQDFRKKHGNCRVPFRYKEDPQLGPWVALQRRNYKLMKNGHRNKTSLTSDRKKRLLEIGFEWSVEITWDDRFIQFLEFVAIRGHAQVPMKWKENTKLSNWVSAQRREYKNLQSNLPSSITQNQIQLLNSVGFIWQAEKGRSKKRRREDNSSSMTHVSKYAITAKKLLQTLRSNKRGIIGGGGDKLLPSKKSVMTIERIPQGLCRKMVIDDHKNKKSRTLEDTDTIVHNSTREIDVSSIRSRNIIRSMFPTTGNMTEQAIPSTLDEVTTPRTGITDINSSASISQKCASLIHQGQQQHQQSLYPHYGPNRHVNVLLNQINGVTYRDNPAMVPPFLSSVSAGIVTPTIGILPTASNGLSITTVADLLPSNISLSASSSSIANLMSSLAGQHRVTPHTMISQLQASPTAYSNEQELLTIGFKELLERK